ncbi:hypothetical protein KAW50_04970, partial [candidate division WOR-3 bacterium]|nr:hypothetical protein [candidate division WOR-3 bacterium]
MERIDKYVSSLTNRFRMDRELHMDVKNELKSHLEDKVSENMASGMSEEKSIEEALKQFGPPEELANQIWKANIRRMRMRSVVKWALRVTLGPAAIAFTIFHFISSFCIDTNILLGQLTLTQSQENLIVRTLSVLSNKLAKSTDSIISTLETRQQKNLTDDERFILNADAEAIAKRFPNNPVYCANDILVYLSKDRGKRSNKDSKEFSEILSKLNKGENLEPENSFYNYLKAGILMSASSGLEKNPGS